MLVNVKGKNIQVTDALKQYAEKKVQKLGKHFKEIKQAQVTQSVQRNWHIVEVQVEGDGVTLRGEERTDNMYSSIDQVVEKLEKRIMRFKGKLYGKTLEEGPKEKEALREAISEEVAASDETEASAWSMPGIVRTKSFAVKPMAPDEATVEMELLHHDFYVFLNDRTEQVNVVYRRKDGDFGLIEPAV